MFMLETRWWSFVAHRVLQCINFTVERLNLPPGLIGLLLGLPQRISIALGRLSQISKLWGPKKTTPWSVKKINPTTKKKKRNQKCMHKVVIVLIGPPWTCTTPRIPACSSGRWSHIEPWCPSAHRWGLVWCHRPPPSSTAASAQSLGHPEFPVDNENKC